VKLLKRDSQSLVFQLGRREKELLAQLVGLYPLVPADYSRCSKGSKVPAASQQLLEEALAEHRSEQQRRLSGMLNDSDRWSQDQHGWILRLSTGELEWLLQILNDIRIGSWIQLGSPEQNLETIDERTAPHLWAMEIAGSFIMALLHTLESPLPSSPAKPSPEQ
jgi:hypothetical protein